MINLNKSMDSMSAEQKLQILRMLYRKSLSAFIQKSFGIVSPGDKYLHNWHIDVIADKLEKCVNGEIKRLIITVPPRYGKSICVSVAFIAWLLGHEPHSKIIGVSYGSDLSEKHSQDCKKLMESGFYSEVFPGTKLSARDNTKALFRTCHGGYRISTSVGGPLTGLGGDFLIIDDPIKPQDALSETQRKHINNWYDNTLYTRLNDKQNGCIIIVMQRVHEDDLAGHVLDQEDWVHLNLPAIAEQAEEHLIHPFGRGQKLFRRKEGEALHPEREPLEQLNKLRTVQLGSYNFSAQYQQKPAPLGGGLIKYDWFQVYTQLPEEGYIRTIQSWDTASKTENHNDYSVCTTWHEYEYGYYLADLFRKRLDFPYLVREVKKLYEKYRPNSVVIEDKSSGINLIQQLQTETKIPVFGHMPKTDKKTRAMTMTPHIEAGKVFVPKYAPWLAELESEVIHFPNGKHDDQIDSITQAIEYMLDNQPSSFFIA